MTDLDRAYHDTEWGVPVHDDRKQFEYLLMEAMQCGLSWGLMLRKRETFRQCFADFDFEKVARYGDADVARILATENMIRSERKIRAIINNAQCFLEVRAEFKTFSDYLWHFTEGKALIYRRSARELPPVKNDLSERISRDMKKRGLKFLGPVVIYSHLQGCGIINDHDRDCPCFARIKASHPFRLV